MIQRLFVVALAALVFCAAARGDLTIKGEFKVEPYKLVRLTAEGAAPDAALIWDFDEERLDAEESGNRLLFAAPPGTYKIKVRAITVKDGKTKAETARATVVIAGKPDPGPSPGPTPQPDPAPKDEAPIKAPGNRVLIVYESADLQKLPSKQLNVIYSKAVRDYLTAKCVADAENPKGAWRIWDKDADASAEAKPWQDALKRQRTQTPWIVISNGKTGHEGPLPQTADETLALLKKHLGE